MSSRPEKFRFVCATRHSRDEFLARSPLGRSLALFRSPFIELTLFENNRTGLPRLYNQAIRHAAVDPAILLFIHDDIHLCDFFWPYHVLDGLRFFEIVGLAGNKRRLPRQPSWYFVDQDFNADQPENFSGIVAHGNGFPPANVSNYGMPSQEVKLLDGLLLVVRSQTLHQHALTFDERFEFHLYDMDFCRQAEVKGLRMGTWTLSVIHESGGGFDSPSWREACVAYFEKWGS